MKKMIIFDPAMCCSTGVCGPSVDSELLRISTLLNTLKSNGILVERYNLSQNPQIFIDNPVINKIINKHGIDKLPVTIVDGEIVKTNGYLTNEEFIKYLEISPDMIRSQSSEENSCCDDNSCCCNDSNCCDDSNNGC